MRRGGGRARGASPFTAFVTRPRRRGSRVVKIREGLAFDGSTHDAFESSDHVIVFRCDERERVACALCASSAPDAMDVGVGSVGHVEVEDVRDAVDIETTRRDVGGDHDREMSALETAEGLLALSLCTIAVQTCDAMSGVRDLARQLIGAMFGAGKDEHRIGIGLLEQFQQQP